MTGTTCTGLDLFCRYCKRPMRPGDEGVRECLPRKRGERPAAGDLEGVRRA